MSQEVCRLCLKSNNLRNIFFNSAQSDKYTLVLALTTGLKIECNDGLPQKICKECTDLVNSALKLRNQAHKTEIELIKLGYQRITSRSSKKAEEISENPINNADTEENNSLMEDGENIFENLSTDCYDFDGFKIEVELDRITQNGDECLSQSIDTEKSEEAKAENIQVERESSRKEKRLLYMSMIDGDFNPNGPVKCKVCAVTVSKWTCFVNHAKKHLGFKFVCEYCGKSFISSNQLKRHCRSFHGMRRDLKCLQCDYYALDNAQLMIHVRRTHTGERPFVCDECGNAYFSRKCLVQHTESHRTEATVQCDQCPLVFKSRRHLAKHRYGTHTDKRRVRRRQRRAAGAGDLEAI